MGVYLELPRYETIFNSCKSKPVFISDLDLTTEDGLEELKEKVYTTYTDDGLEVLPSCDCKRLKGGDKIGITCPVCGTICLPSTEKPFESLLWVKVPNGVDVFISPVFWTIMSSKMTVKKVNIFEWLVNTRYPLPDGSVPKPIKKLMMANVPRGLNNFYRNFDEIMEFLVNKKIIGKIEVESWMKFINENKKAFFTDKLPLPSRLAFVAERGEMKSFRDPLMGSALEAIWTLNSVNTSTLPINHSIKEDRVIKSIKSLAEFYNNFFGAPLGHKQGWLRKHVYGARGHWTFRGVITSISEPHDLEEIHLPWALSVMVFKIHLVSKLTKLSKERLLQYGFTKDVLTPNAALKHINEHAFCYSKLLDDMFKELIAEGPGYSIKCLLNRNPTLTIGSIQTLRITKVKTSVKNNTIDISLLILKSFNADKIM